MNGVSYNPILDQVIWSSHNMSEIYVIDHSTTTAQAASHSGGNSGMGGDLLYRWGHPAAYSATGTQILHVVHDAHWNPEGVPNAGYVGGYNNQGVSSSASCADQVSPPYNGYNYSITLGSAFAPANYTIRQVSGGHEIRLRTRLYSTPPRYNDGDSRVPQSRPAHGLSLSVPRTT